MTTKKQRREQTAAKTQAERAALANENLEALRRTKHKEEQRKFEKTRAENKKKAAAKIKEMAEGTTPDNLVSSAEALGIDVTRKSDARDSYGHAENLLPATAEELGLHLERQA